MPKKKTTVKRKPKAKVACKPKTKVRRKSTPPKKK